jgi:hypothetical protein
MTSIELANLIVSSVSTLLSATAIFLYIVLWYKDKDHDSYDTFDTLYLDILKTAIEYPDLRNPEYIQGYKSLPSTERIRYEAYAFIVWNFCETIYDKSSEELLRTWIGVLVTENRLHSEWFAAPENSHIFKDEFKTYVKNTLTIE